MGKERIGIISIHYGVNFGSALQAIALSRYLKENYKFEKEGFKAVHEYLVNGGKSCMAGFVVFFKKEVPADPMKAEYLIPTFIGELLAENKMSVKVLRSNDTWYGMTYKEDVVTVKESFEEMLKTEVYKEDLFSDL